MPEITIRRLVGDEIVRYYAPLHQYSLSGGATPPINLTRYEKYPNVYEESPVLALFEDDKVVATTFGIPMTQNVRGKVYPMVGIAGVTGLVLAIAASAAVQAFRRPASGPHHDLALTLALLALAAVGVPAAVVTAGFAGLTGA